MRIALLVSFALAVLLPAQEKKPKPPELEITQAAVRRMDEQMLSADGTVKNTGVKPLNKVQLVLEFFAPGKQSIVIQKGAIDSGTLLPGESAEFHLQLRTPARAVHVTINAEDGATRELRVGKAGPYPVE